MMAQWHFPVTDADWLNESLQDRIDLVEECVHTWSFEIACEVAVKLQVPLPVKKPPHLRLVINNDTGAA